MSEEPDAPARPLLRVVRGTPDDAELAALTTVLASLAGTGPPPAPPRPRSAWANRSAGLRKPQRPGPGAWRASALPG